MGVKSARRPNSDSKRRRGQTTGGRTKLPPPSSRGVGGEGRCYPKELHGHQAEPLLLEPFDDLAHQAALHAIWLDGNEGTLEVGHGPKAGGSAGVCDERQKQRAISLFLITLGCGLGCNSLVPPGVKQSQRKFSW